MKCYVEGCSNVANKSVVLHTALPIIGNTIIECVLCDKHIADIENGQPKNKGMGWSRVVGTEIL